MDRNKNIPIKKFSEYIYLNKYEMDNRPLCKCCDNKVDYIDFTHGYRTYCSTKCLTNDPDIINKSMKSKENKYGKENLCNYKKSAQTKLERYGDSNYINIDKMKQTKLERYGNEYYTNREKAKQTCLERYGLEIPMKNNEISKRSLENKIKKYGVDNISNQLKTKQTCLERYGVENVSQVPEFIDNIKQTKLERYGDEYYTNREKAKQTCLERYGTENVFEVDEIKSKVIGTNLKKYGVDNVAKLKDFQEKQKQTCLDRYGKKYYTQTDKYKNYIKEITPEIQTKIYNTKLKNNTFNSSSIEKEFEKWLILNNINYIYQYKSDEYPFVCDFYFPDRKFYLEIQGYWSHGGHPYDPNNPNDVKIANKWRKKDTKQYLDNLVTWTQRDPQKREVAKNNNLNWKEIFTCNLNELIKEVKDFII